MRKILICSSRVCLNTTLLFPVIYIISSYSTWIFCRGNSGFTTDCPCGVWCRGLTTCLLHVWQSTFKQQLGCRFDIMDSISSFFLYFDICNYICLDTSYHFSALSFLLRYCSLFFQIFLY